MNASWKTSLFGTAGLLAVLCPAVLAQFDGDPATKPNWLSVISAVSVCVGLLFARDNKVTSEQAGAVDISRPTPPR